MRIPPYPAPATALVVLIAFSGSVLAQEAPAIRQIELGQSGLARYTLAVQVSGDRISFEVPNEDADDVLASLIVRDPAGGVYAVQTDTPSSVPEALRGGAFSGGMPGDVQGLLDALKGQTVTITTATDEVKGQVVAVTSRDMVDDQTLVQRPVALLLSGEQIVEIVLNPGVKVSFDKQLTNQLAEAGTASRAGDGQRLFEIVLESEKSREITLSYVTEAPAWKNSWRLLLDEGRLQGWAALENVSGHDWDHVEITLSTGSPVAYERNLLAPQRFDRLTSPDLIGGRPSVVADEGMVQSAKANRLALGGIAQAYSADAAAELASPAPASGGVAEPEIVKSPTNTRYTVPWKVDLADGRSANLLYVDLEISPQIQALYQPSRNQNVILAAEISAGISLAPGLVSVQDANGFVGDAPFTGLEGGQSRLLPFGLAPGASVLTDLKSNWSVSNLSFVGDTLAADVGQTTRTTYAATLPGKIDIFAVEHPYGRGNLDSATGDVERGANAYRVSTPVVDGKAEVTLVETSTSRRSVGTDRNQLAAFIAEMRRADPAMDAKALLVLKDAGDVLNATSQAERTRDQLNERYNVLTREQERLRQNLRAVQQSALRDRYVAALESTESDIADTLKAIEDVNIQIQQAETKLVQVLTRLN